MDLRTADFEYNLPSELIAQEPAPERDLSRLLVLDRRTGSMRHDVFRSIGDYLSPGDLLVANRSRVIPARLTLRKRTGGTVEVLLLERKGPRLWLALARPSRRLRPGMDLDADGSALTARLEEDRGEGQWLVRFLGDDVDEELHRLGSVPLPPYITRPVSDPERYQTVYADREGSVAAPTAGLHFTPDLLTALDRRGIESCFLTLHVGLGTFKPITAGAIGAHRMHAEWGEVTAEVAERANAVRRTGGKLVSVGTTTTRLLESAACNGEIRPFRGTTDIFIYPGHRFQAVDALVTNFHLPHSTVLMLVSAFAGRELILEAYQEAIRLRYRFYSFGDAMLIL